MDADRDAGQALCRSVLPDGWQSPKGFAHGVVVDGPCRLLSVAGQVAWDAEARLVGRGDFVAQWRQALSNVVQVLRAAGGGPEHVMEMTVYVTDTKLYSERLKEIGAAWRDVMGRNFPAMALVQVAALLEDGALLEIQARAALPPMKTPG